MESYSLKYVAHMSHTIKSVKLEQNLLLIHSTTLQYES
jgi:hypothetical protein